MMNFLQLSQQSMKQTNTQHTNNVELEFFQGLITVIVMRNLCVSSAKVGQVYEFYNNQV
jgi:hypothetical protein